MKIKINWGLILTLVGSLIAGIGTYVQTNDQIKEQVEDTLKENDEGDDE